MIKIQTKASANFVLFNIFDLNIKFVSEDQVVSMLKFHL